MGSVPALGIGAVTALAALLAPHSTHAPGQGDTVTLAPDASYERTKVRHLKVACGVGTDSVPISPP